VKCFNNGLNYNDDDDNEEEDDDNNRDLGNYDNAHVNANKGTRQYVVSLFIYIKDLTEVCCLLYVCMCTVNMGS
jgi:hypothetical protein